MVIEITTASFRSTRGYSFAAVLCDEAAFWRSDETSANPDVEILRALRPGLASIPGSMLLLASSPYAKRGELYNAFRRYFGQDQAKVLVWKAATQVMHPSLDPELVARAYEEDPESARAEFGAQFRDDLADFVSRETVDAVTMWGRTELPFEAGVAYHAFCDPSGGVNDAMTLAVGHLRNGDVCVLDAVLDIRPPFDPEKAVAKPAGAIPLHAGHAALAFSSARRAYRRAAAISFEPQRGRFHPRWVFPAGRFAAGRPVPSSRDLWRARLGENGLLRLLRALMDPNKVMTAPLPASGRDLSIAAHNSRVQAFENVSKISDAMSDNLCRLATGGGMRTRALWTNSDEATFAGARPIMAEGIANFITRPDLLDRALVVALEAPPSDRRTERQLWAEFNRCKAGVFGALCDMLATGVRRLPETRLASLPRMADFATWGAACGLDALEAAYARNRQSAVDVDLEHDLLAQSVKAFMATRKEWRGIAQDLLVQIGKAARITSPKALSDQLRRLAQPLHSHGIIISHEARTAKRRESVIAWVER